MYVRKRKYGYPVIQNLQKLFPRVVFISTISLVQ